MRLSVQRVVEKTKLSRSRFYQLIDCGVFPEPIRQDRHMPYYTEDMISNILAIIESGSGTTKDGNVIMFYNMKGNDNVG